MFITTLLDRFCDHASYMKGYSPRTIRRYRTNVDFFVRQTKIEEVEIVTGDLVRSFFYEGRTKRQWSPVTFITYLKSLKVFFRWCVKEGCLEKNPTDDIEKPKLEKKLPPKLTQQEALKILEVVYNYPYDYPYLRYRNHAIFAMFIFAGIRKQELLNLKYTDVDLENLSLFVRQGKGNKDRIIPICNKLAETLRRYLVERKRLNKTCPEFFASLNHNGGLTLDGFTHLMHLAIDASKIKFSAHKLRHTFATLMLEGGCDIFSLSKMMGHSDIKTTTIYLAASAEHLRGEMMKHPLNRL